MGIEGLTVDLSQAGTMNKIATAVMAKSLDMVEQTGASMIDMMERSMMERSVNPNLGGNFDVMV